MTAVANPSKMVDEFRGKITKRLDELKPALEEANQLSDVLARLDGNVKAPASPGRPKGSRTRQGGRRDQYLQIVRDNPGITVAEAAEKMAVQPNYLYRIREKVQAEGLVRMDGKRAFPVEKDDGEPSAERIAELEAAAAGTPAAA